jgi:CarD family transcriptional regulator
LREKVPTKSASAKKLAPVNGAEPEIIDAAPVAAAPVAAPAAAAAVEEAALEDDAVVKAAASPAPANDSLPPPLPRPSPSFGGGSRAPGGVPGRMMPPPRPMAKAENFVEGDHVVYPTHGVGKVERIATEEIAGHKLELIHITFEENRMTLRVPVAKARTAGLRKLATRKLFDEALAVLKGRARIKRTMWSRRAQEYEAKINSGDPLSIAEVVRDLHRNAGQPDQSFSERQIYEAAMDRLAAELAALERIDKTAAATKLVEFLKTV